MKIISRYIVERRIVFYLFFRREKVLKIFFFIYDFLCVKVFHENKCKKKEWHTDVRLKFNRKKDSTSIRDLCINYGRLFAKYYVNLVTDD